MPGPAPRPDRLRANAPTFDWVLLPRSGRRGSTPKLPGWRSWTPATTAWWRSLWRTPQACAWDQSGASLWTLAVLHHELVEGERSTAAVSAEMRAHEDRHGLNPKALLQLRWRVVDDEHATIGKATARPGKAAPRPSNVDDSLMDRIRGR